MQFDLSRENPGYPEGSEAGGSGNFHFRDDYVKTQCLDFSRELIKSYVKNLKNGTIVEIGVFGGATLLHLFDVCEQNNNKLIGIDPWEKIEIFNGINKSELPKNVLYENLYFSNRVNLERIIQKYNLKNISLIHDNSYNVYNTFEDNSIDILHIDGDHSTNGVYNDLKNFYPKVRGVIIGDDYTWKSVSDGLHKFCKEFNVEYIPLPDIYKYIIIKK